MFESHHPDKKREHRKVLPFFVSNNLPELGVRTERIEFDAVDHLTPKKESLTLKNSRAFLFTRNS